MFVLKYREIFIAKYPTIHPSLYEPLSLAGLQGAWAFFSWYHARSRSNSTLFDSPLQGLTDGDGQGLSSLSNLGGNLQSPVYLMCFFWTLILTLVENIAMIIQRKRFSILQSMDIDDREMQTKPSFSTCHRTLQSPLTSSFKPSQ